jgi:hypothetical protein
VFGLDGGIEDRGIHDVGHVIRELVRKDIVDPPWIHTRLQDGDVCSLRLPSLLPLLVGFVPGVVARVGGVCRFDLMELTPELSLWEHLPVRRLDHLSIPPLPLSPPIPVPPGLTPSLVGGSVKRNPPSRLGGLLTVGLEKNGLGDGLVCPVRRFGETLGELEEDGVAVGAESV